MHMSNMYIVLNKFILGGSKMDDWMTYYPYMPMWNIPQQYYYPMTDYDDDRLQSMYPRIYNDLYPMVNNYCDMMERKYGPMYTPTREEMDSMIEDMNRNLGLTSEQPATEQEGSVETLAPIEYGADYRHYDRHHAVNDLARILFLKELMRRRKMHHIYDHRYDNRYDHRYDNYDHYGNNY